MEMPCGGMGSTAATQIDDKHAALLAAGFLNLENPVGPEETLYAGGSMRPYEHGRIYFHPRVGKANRVARADTRNLTPDHHVRRAGR